MNMPKFTYTIGSNKTVDPRETSKFNKKYEY